MLVERPGASYPSTIIIFINYENTRFPLIINARAFVILLFETEIYEWKSLIVHRGMLKNREYLDFIPTINYEVHRGLGFLFFTGVPEEL